MVLELINFLLNLAIVFFNVSLGNRKLKYNLDNYNVHLLKKFQCESCDQKSQPLITKNIPIHKIILTNILLFTN